LVHNAYAGRTGVFNNLKLPYSARESHQNFAAENRKIKFILCRRWTRKDAHQNFRAFAPQSGNDFSCAGARRREVLFIGLMRVHRRLI
jgi:hypothetical protein